PTPDPPACVRGRTGGDLGVGPPSSGHCVRRHGFHFRVSVRTRWKDDGERSKLCAVPFPRRPRPMTNGETTVAGLLARARDREALDHLFGACRGYLRVLARARLESWLQAKVDPSDLVQQSMLDAFRGFGQFQGVTSAEWLAWLRRIVEHNAADLVRFYHGADKRQVGREVVLGDG